MKKQISFIAPGQTAKALILVYLTFSVPIVLLGVLVAFIRYRVQRAVAECDPRFRVAVDCLPCL
jgi:type IV secretory pathway TrbD component